MKKKTFAIFALLIALVFVGCQEKSKGGGNSSTAVIGTVVYVDEAEKIIHVDLSSWAVKEGLLNEDEDMNFMESFTITDETLLADENGKIATFDEIEWNQKVKVFESEEKHEFKDEIILLESPEQN